VTLTRFDGTPLRLADLRGSVVVVNFWASWCDPCRREAPAFQSASDAVIVGVGLKNDQDDDARAFVAELGLTYPIGRDTGGDNPSRGPIELAFGIDPFYPTTIFIRPDGVIDAVHVGELDADAIRAGIEAAAG
jgi:thiol-disulfide isomerase/thioredoxin